MTGHSLGGYEVTEASLHDSRVFEEIVDERNSGKGYGLTALTVGSVWRESFVRRDTEVMYAATAGLS